MLFSKFDQALSGDYVHVSKLSQNEIHVNKKYAGRNHQDLNAVMITSHILSAAFPSHRGGTAACFALAKQPRYAFKNPFPGRPGQHVCSQLNGNRPFHTLPNRHTGDSEGRCFFLEAAAVRQHNLRVLPVSGFMI
jgi:hypothetical protein